MSRSQQWPSTLNLIAFPLQLTRGGERQEDEARGDQQAPQDAGDGEAEVVEAVAEEDAGDGIQHARDGVYEGELLVLATARQLRLQEKGLRCC